MSKFISTKNLISICFAPFLISVCFLPISVSAQLSIWHSNQKKFDFTTDTEADIRYNGSPSDLQLASNGIYKSTRNTGFYIADSKVLNGYGDKIGNLGYVYKPMYLVRPEIAVVPVPGISCKYYIIYLELGPSNPYEDALCYNTVDLSGNNSKGTLSGVTELFSTTGGAGTPWPVTPPSITAQFNPGIAVGPLSGSSRYLYVFRGKTVYKFTISSTGIAYNTYFTVGSTIEAISELEISPDGTKIAWGNISPNSSGTSKDIGLADLNASGDITTSNEIKFPTSVGKIFGMEFNSNSDELFVCTENNGVATISNLSSPVFSFISGTNSFNNSNVELAINGKMYLRNSSQLLSIDESTYTINTSSPNGIGFLSSTNLTHGWSFYALPDQIDGFDYDTYIAGNSCCDAIYDQLSLYEVEETGTWTNNNNPINPFSDGTLYFKEGLKVPQGILLNIVNMELNFDVNALVNVSSIAEFDPSGSVTGLSPNGGGALSLRNNTIFSDMSATCVGSDGWLGIRVDGYSADPQYAHEVLGPIGAQFKQFHQGFVEVENSTIQNAYIGIRSGGNTPFAGTTADQSTGGIIIAKNSHFVDNAYSVVFRGPYEHRLASSLSYNEFKMTSSIFSNLTSPRTEYAFIKLQDVTGVRLTSNDLIDNRSNPESLDNPHVGIDVEDSELDLDYRCNDQNVSISGCQNIDPNIFKNLYIGVRASATLPESPFFNVQEAEFTNNSTGVRLSDYTSPRVINSKFDGNNIDWGSDVIGVDILRAKYLTMENNEFNLTDANNTTAAFRVEDCNQAPTEIYRNDIKAADYGIWAKGDNSVFSVLGFTFNCNKFNTTDHAVFIDNARIAGFQGYCELSFGEPKANIFTSNCQGEEHIKVSGLSQSVVNYSYYDSPTGENFEPTCNSTSVNTVFCELRQTSYNQTCINRQMQLGGPVSIMKNSENTISHFEDLLYDETKYIETTKLFRMVEEIATINKNLLTFKYESDGIIGNHENEGLLTRCAEISNLIFSRFRKLNYIDEFSHSSNNELLRLFPNPSNGVFKVELLNDSMHIGSICIFDKNGKLVMTRNTNLEQGGNIYINLENLPSTSYFFKFYDTSGNTIGSKVAYLIQ